MGIYKVKNEGNESGKIVVIKSKGSLFSGYTCKEVEELMQLTKVYNKNFNPYINRREGKLFGYSHVNIHNLTVDIERMISKALLVMDKEELDLIFRLLSNESKQNEERICLALSIGLSPVMVFMANSITNLFETVPQGLNLGAFLIVFVVIFISIAIYVWILYSCLIKNDTPFKNYKQFYYNYCREILEWF